MAEPAIIRLFRPEDAAAFRDLNYAWIQQYFTIEEKDEALLHDPQTYIFDKGGNIIIAEDSGRVVGCAALVPRDDGPVELAKMAVDPSAQGKGIGRAIVGRAIDEARQMGAKRLWLESNTVLETAIRLYRRCGFTEVTGDSKIASPYSKCNIQMYLDI